MERKRLGSEGEQDESRGLKPAGVAFLETRQLPTGQLRGRRKKASSS